MSDENAENIFEAASKAYGSGKKTPKSDKPSKTKEPLPPATEEEIREQFSRVEGQYKDLKDRADEAYERAGLRREEVTRFLENPSNFTPDMWQSIEALRAEEEAALSRQVGVNVEKAERKRKLAASAKKKRRKFLGSRKKWMKMD